MTLRAPFDLYAEGLKNLSSGHIGEAQQAFLNLALGPGKDPELAAKSFAQLGMISFRFKNYTEALWAFDAAADLDPDSLLARAICLFGLGLGDEAEAEFKALSKLNPNDEVIRKYLGRIALQNGDPKAAADIFKEFEDPEGRVELGLCLEGMGKQSEAEALYAGVRQDHPDFYQGLLDETDRYMAFDLEGPAAALLEKAERVAPEDANVWFYLGLRYYTLGRAGDAARVYKHGIKISPLLSLYQELSSLYEKSNDLKRARQALKTPLHYFPDDPKANLVQALCDFRLGKIAAAETRLKGVLGGAENAYTRADILNLLGRIYDKMGDYEKAIEAFQASKDALTETGDYADLEPESQSRLLRDLAALSPPPNKPERTDKSRYAPKQLVFFIGFPRSGTTLIENVLAGHPEIVTTEERSLMLGPIGDLERMAGGYPAAASGLGSSQIALLRERYFTEILSFNRDVSDKVLVDKMPLNLIHLPLIRALFPEAKILFAVRHPCAVALSCLMQNFALNNAMANLMSFDGITAFYEQAMGLWQKTVAAGGFEHHVIRYEDVVANLAAEAEKITAFLGLDMTPKMLDFTKQAKSKSLVHTPSYSQVVRPVYKDALERWRHYEKWLAPYRDRLDPYIEMFGYRRG